VHRIVVLLAIPFLLLIGCSSGGKGGSSVLPTVTGPFGAKPTITIPKSDPGDTLVANTLIEGTGQETHAGDLLEVNYLGQVWKGGKFADNSYDPKTPYTFPLGKSEVIPGWDKGLAGKKVGSRVLLVIPPVDAYGDVGRPKADIPPKSTLVFVVDILKSVPKNGGIIGTMVAQGTKDDLPIVTAEPGQVPQIAIPAGTAAPTTLRDKVLVPGSGPEVKREQMVYVQYVGVLWNGGQEFDSSWKRGSYAPFQIGVGQVIPGWDKALVGKKVGSRVLLVIPPSDGYGDRPQGSIPPKSTLVFVVDILGASS
jgi:peptidylprolyl isomerase